MNSTPVEKAVQAAGGKAALAAALNLTYEAIRQWKHIPTKRLLEVERITGIPRSELRPDLFGQ